VTGQDERSAASRLGDWGRDSRQAFADVREPQRLPTAVVTFHRRVDEVLKTSIEGRGVKVACERGCSYCCHLRVEVQPAEAFTLAAWLRRTASPERLGEVLAKLRANVERSRALGAEARKRTTIACALLGDDGACTAYEARPAQCRRYHSTSVDPCRDFYNDPSRDTIESGMDEAIAHNADVIITQARHALRDVGLDDTATDMNVALLEALENPKAWRRWRSGKKAFGLMARLEKKRS
jgi:Fe-S-cluster containining protein